MSRLWVDANIILHFITKEPEDMIDAYLAHQAAASGERVCSFDTTDFRKLPVESVTPDL